MTVQSIIKAGHHPAYMTLKYTAQSPSVVYWVDHFQSTVAGVVMRHQIKALSADDFEVTEYKIILNDVNRTVYRRVLGTTSHMVGAKEIIETQVVVLEDDGWIFMDEATLPLAKLAHEIDGHLGMFTMEAIDAQEWRSLFISGMVNCIKIPKGVRCFAHIDEYGRCYVKATADSRSTWVEAESAISMRLHELQGVVGMRSAVLECVIHGSSVMVIDALYLHDHWLVHSDVMNRHAEVQAYFETHNLSLPLLKPTKVAVAAVPSLLFDDTKGVLVLQHSRVLVSRTVIEVMFSAGYQKTYTLKQGHDLRVGDTFHGEYIPDLSYFTFESTGQGGEAFFHR